MKSTTKPRLARLAGLFLLSLLVLAIAVPMAQAAAVDGSGAGGGPGGLVATAGTQGRGGVSYAPVAVVPGSAAAGVTPRSAGVQPTSGSSSSTTAWIIAGSVVAASLVALAAWALVGRSRRRQSLTAFCVQYPSDAACLA
jgi:hypothetical protein